MTGLLKASKNSANCSTKNVEAQHEGPPLLAADALVKGRRLTRMFFQPLVAATDQHEHRLHHHVEFAAPHQARYLVEGRTPPAEELTHATQRRAQDHEDPQLHKHMPIDAHV